MSIEFGWTIPSGIADKSRRGAYLSSVDRDLARIVGRFSSAWMVDHFQWDNRNTLECWTTLTYLAARHPDLKFGTAVLSQSFRNPALVAKMAATFQFLSGGRLLFGIGAGWKQDEYDAYGYPFPAAGTRVAELAEALQIVKAMWAASPEPASFGGQHYRVVEAWCEPKPAPIPPIVVGGTGKRMLRLIARYADWWNVSWMGYEEYKQLLDEMRRACDEVGRDFGTLRKTWFGPAAIAPTPAEAEGIAAGGFSDSNGFVGTCEYFVEKIERFAALGVDLFIFGVRGFPHPRGTELMIDEVLPRVGK